MIGALIADLNELEEDPQSAHELKTMLHERGIPMRYLGKLCTEAHMNHIREIAVIEVIARSTKAIVRNALASLSQEEAEAFTKDSIRKCVHDHLRGLFLGGLGGDVKEKRFWSLMSDYSRRKFGVSIEPSILAKVHLNALLMNVLDKLNVKLRVDIRDVDFFNEDAEEGSSFLKLDDIEHVRPTCKDYRFLGRDAGDSDRFPYSINQMMELARELDASGRTSQWFMRGGPEREEATRIFQTARLLASTIFGDQSLHTASIIREMA